MNLDPGEQYTSIDRTRYSAPCLDTAPQRRRARKPTAAAIILQVARRLQWKPDILKGMVLPDRLCLRYLP